MHNGDFQVSVFMWCGDVVQHTGGVCRDLIIGVYQRRCIVTTDESQTLLSNYFQLFAGVHAQLKMWLKFLVTDTSCFGGH